MAKARVSLAAIEALKVGAQMLQEQINGVINSLSEIDNVIATAKSKIGKINDSINECNGAIAIAGVKKGRLEQQKNQIDEELNNTDPYIEELEPCGKNEDGTTAYKMVKKPNPHFAFLQNLLNVVSSQIAHVTSLESKLKGQQNKLNEAKSQLQSKIQSLNQQKESISTMCSAISCKNEKAISGLTRAASAINEYMSISINISPSVSYTYVNFDTTPAVASIGELSNDLRKKGIYRKQALQRKTKVTGKLIPGTRGKVEGGYSDKATDDMIATFDNSKARKLTRIPGYQQHHIIPCRRKKQADGSFIIDEHPILKKIGMNLDDESNGIFLPTSNKVVRGKTVHKGRHNIYNQAVFNYLDTLDVNEDADVLERKVYDLQQVLKRGLMDGLPMYGKKKMSKVSIYKTLLENCQTEEERSRLEKKFSGLAKTVKSRDKVVQIEDRGGGATVDLWTRYINKNIGKR